MKVYTLEFRFFDGAAWGVLDVEITATNMFQLMRAFINETATIHDGNASTPSAARRALWNEVKRWITEEDFSFPIINIKTQR